MRYIDGGMEVATIIETIDKVRRRYLVTDGHLPNLGDRDVQRYFFGTLKRIQEETEPSKPPCDEATLNKWFDGGEEFGRVAEHRRLGKIIRSYTDHGYASLADAVIALFPDAD